METSEAIISRLAPTPSGFLHIGNVFNFVYTWLEVRRSGGVLHLRIDDIDRARVRRMYVDDVFSTLDWLGMDYDAGPSGTDDFFQNFSQHHRLDSYQQEITALQQKAVTYNCQCSRKLINKNATANGQYARTCKSLGLAYKENKTSLRLDTSAAQGLPIFAPFSLPSLDEIMCDFIIQGKNRLPSYQLVSIIDDVVQKVNLIVRGEDLLPSTGAQLWMAHLLSHECFLQAKFIHHPLLKSASQQKLSKSQKASSLKQQFPEKKEVFSYLSQQLGLSKKCSSLQELLKAYKEAGTFPSL